MFPRGWLKQLHVHYLQDETAHRADKVLINGIL